MGRRRARQESLFVLAEELPRSGGHPFYQKLNALLAEAEFDRWAEGRCEAYYEPAGSCGRRSIPPGVYFRMLLVGYFEGIDSRRGIAWRCADGLSLRQFLGLGLADPTPDHSSLTRIRKRLPIEVCMEVFQFVLAIADKKRLLSGRTVGVDSTTLEANAAMKSIVRRDTGEDWREYVTRLMREEGALAEDEAPSDDELRRFDRRRKKKVGNDEWTSKSDSEARITKLKDGRAHLAYKAEHVVDLTSALILAAEIYRGTHADGDTFGDSIMEAQVNLEAAGSDAEIQEAAADKGYHAAATLELAQDLNLRAYTAEPKLAHNRNWTDKPPEYQQAVYANRRRIRRAKGKRLQRRRSELCERSFARLCDSGGMRRSWLRGLMNVRKRYLIAAAAHNLGRILRRLFGQGKPKAPQGLRTLAGLMCLALLACLRPLQHHPAAA